MKKFIIIALLSIASFAGLRAQSQEDDSLAIAKNDAIVEKYLNETPSLLPDSVVVKQVDAGFIHISKEDMMLYLYDSMGKQIFAFPIACAKVFGAKKKMMDGKTPEGVFTVMSAVDATHIPYRTDDGRYVMGVYGPYFIRLNCPVAQHHIGIHGTGTPSSIGKRCSHGCIRLHNENVRQLYPYVYVGMPVIITPSFKDMKVDHPNQ